LGNFMLIIRNAIAQKTTEKENIMPPTDQRYFYHLTKAALGFIGVAIGAYVVIQSVIALSAFFQISEYLISFFVVAIGTSLPEHVVDFAAVRQQQYKLAMGDIIGSCIFDAYFPLESVR